MRATAWQVIRRVLLSAVCIYVGLSMVNTWRRSRPDTTWATIQQTGVIRVGMDVSFPPFAAVIDGKPAGIDVDVAEAIGERLHARVEIVTVGFDGLYDALLNKRVDILISALAFDPARLGSFLYSRPYFDAGQILVSRDGAFQMMPQLEGRTVAVEYGSVADEVVRQWERRLKALNVVRLTTTEDALKAVSAGTVDAALVDVVSARLYRRQHGDLMLAAATVESDNYGVVFRRSSYDLVEVVNRALDAMEADGTLANLLAHWL
ncbi:MAG: amino acid ABC transporter substrate-binding protein [Anaerolineae bacterium]|nr:amino acid ABC transporter substrate-binding protein [Anaerolineae bacterium]